MGDWYGEASRAIGREFTPPFEMYEPLALSIAEYDLVWEMDTGKSAGKDQCMIFTMEERIRHILAGIGRNVDHFGILYRSKIAKEIGKP